MAKTFQLLKFLGFKQSALAAMLEVSPQAISKWLTLETEEEFLLRHAEKILEVSAKMYPRSAMKFASWLGNKKPEVKKEMFFSLLKGASETITLSLVLFLEFSDDFETAKKIRETAKYLEELAEK